MSKPEPRPVLLTVEEAAILLRCSPVTVYRHVSNGVLPAVRVGGLVRVPPSALASAAGLAPDAILPEASGENT